MDRAHRLGQTRQVTVYRLITKGTIEERIRKRAMQKEEVQRVVISGGAGATSGVDFSGRRAPENRNRDIAMWLADDDQAELIERRERELLENGEYDKATKKSGGNKRKRAAKDGAAAAAAAANGEGTASLDDMYHEGEPHFGFSTGVLNSPPGEDHAAAQDGLRGQDSVVPRTLKLRVVQRPPRATTEHGEDGSSSSSPVPKRIKIRVSSN
jgi:DNA helicase INO80